MARRTYDDDDGRTIADMSGFEARTPFGFRRSAGKEERTGKPEQNGGTRNGTDCGISREDRRGYVWGALSAALLIGLAFIAGLGLVIALIVWIFA